MKFTNLKEGNIFSEQQFYTVVKIAGNKAQLKTLRGEMVVLDDKYIETCLDSAHDYTKTENITRTEISKKFLTCTNIAFTVVFQKQVKDKDVIDDLEKLYPNTGKIMSKADYIKAVKAAIKKALEGETRILRGYHTGEQDEFGRISCVDMEIITGHNKRLVDTRTISELIVKGIQYKVK